MLKKVIRLALPAAVALGLMIPSFSQEPQKTEKNKTKKRTDKSKGKGGGERRKTEQPKSQ